MFLGAWLALYVLQVEVEAATSCGVINRKYNKCTRKAYQDYQAAVMEGQDDREDWEARKACNYLEQAVEVCGDEFLPMCNSEEKVEELKKNQIRGTLKNLEKSIAHWDTEKCPAVRNHIDRMKAEPTKEFVTDMAMEYQEATSGSTHHLASLILTFILLVITV